MGRRSVRSLAGVALLALVWGCGGSAGSSPSTAGGAASAAPSVAPSIAQASLAEPSNPEPSAAEPSFAIPSFTLPSNAKDLEAILPSTVCGQTAIKTSDTGEHFVNQADNKEFATVLQAIGKSPSDVGFAIAVSSAECLAGIFRIKGVDTGTFQSAFLSEAQKSGTTYSQATVGGKSVYVDDSGSTKQYLYFKGDAVFFASAKTEAQAATVLQDLP